MCWKNEWAKAVNNLEWAIIHTQRAQGKLEKKRRWTGVDKCKEVIAALGQQQEPIISLGSHSMSCGQPLKSWELTFTK